MFGHQSYIFLSSPLTCSGTFHDVRRGFPSPSVRRARPVAEAISGPRLCHCHHENHRPRFTNTWSLSGPSPFDDTFKAEVKKWLREQDLSFYCQVLDNLTVGSVTCMNKLGDKVKK
jgi:hypothetical protein